MHHHAVVVALVVVLVVLGDAYRGVRRALCTPAPELGNTTKPSAAVLDDGAARVEAGIAAIRPRSNALSTPHTLSTCSGAGLWTLPHHTGPVDTRGLVLAQTCEARWIVTWGMACFSRESGSWGDSCVALLGAACLLVAILASAFTVAQWQRNREAYRWTHCSVGHITDAVWLDCPLNTSTSSSAAGTADLAGRSSSGSSSRVNTTSSSSFPCVRVMVSYLDKHGDHKMGILHPDISAVIPQGVDSPRCSLSPCKGTTAENEAMVRSFSERWRRGYDFDHFSCYVNTEHLGEVFLTRPQTSRVLEVVVLFMVVICVVCILTTVVRCRCVYLNAREARSCIPSMSFYITSSARSLRALLWTVAYKVFDWKLQNSMSQTLSGHDTQGLVEQYREDREDAIDPCLPAAAAAAAGSGGAGSGSAIPRSPSVGYAQPRPSNAQTYTPLACPPSDIRL